MSDMESVKDISSKLQNLLHIPSTNVVETNGKGCENSAIQENVSYAKLTRFVEPSVQPTNMSNKVPDQVAQKFKKFLEMKCCPQLIKDYRSEILRHYTMLEIDKSNLCDTHSMNRVRVALSGSNVCVLDKPNFKFPKAKYYCLLCRYHLNTLLDFVRHVTETRHISTIKNSILGNTVIKLYGLISTNQLKAIGKSLLMFHQDMVRARDSLISEVHKFIDVINERIHSHGAPTICIQLFGSWETELCLPDSNINFVVSLERKLQISEIRCILRALESIDTIKNIEVKERGFYYFNFDADIRKTIKRCELRVNNFKCTYTTDLLREYSHLDIRVNILVRALTYFARKVGMNCWKQGYLPSVGYAVLAIHFLQQEKLVANLSVLPNMDPRGFMPLDDFLKCGEKIKSTVSEEEIATLWLKMIRYYSEVVDIRSYSVCISSSRTRKEGTSGRRVLIHEPITGTNIGRKMSLLTSNWLVEKLRTVFCYFAIPRTKDGAFFDGIVDKGYISTSSFVRSVHKVTDSTNNCKIYVEDSNVSRANSVVPDGVLVFKEKLSSYNCGDSVLNCLNSARERLQKTMALPDMSTDNFFFSLDSKELQSEPPPMTCISCQSDGHCIDSCPAERIPELDEMPSPGKVVLFQISEVIKCVVDLDKPREDELKSRHLVMKDLEEALKYELPNVVLTLIGSSANGFGISGADIDVSMTLKEHPHSLKDCLTYLGDITLTDFILKVERLLVASYLFKNTISITTAKMPIVKFHHVKSRTEGDVSVYNLWAERNTKLLKMYSIIDPRVKVLGCFLKKLVKLCSIADASKASLSSYAYIVMLVHFLQRVEPPVVPVLQQLLPNGPRKGKEIPSNIVSGIETYFYDDIRNLHKVWRCNNHMNLGELWIGFLRYFTLNFNYKDHVITISQLETLTKLDKLWVSDGISIEDPFEKSHNLGSGVTNRMSVHIIKTLQKFYKVFYRGEVFYNTDEAMKNYVNVDLLSEGSAPISDRQCRTCRKIGHLSRTCPSRFSDTKLPGSVDNVLKSEISRVQNSKEDVVTNDTPCDILTSEVEFIHEKSERLLEIINSTKGVWFSKAVKHALETKKIPDCEQESNLVSPESSKSVFENSQWNIIDCNTPN